MTYQPPSQPADPGHPQSGQQPSPPPQPYPPAQYAPPSKKKGGAGKVLLIVIAVLVVLCGGGILIVALAAGGGSKPSTPGTTHVGLNQAARDGKFEFVVTKITCGIPKVGADPLGKAAQGQFCEVTVSVKNIGNQPQTFDGGSQKAKGADGATYGNDGEAEIYANKDTATFLNQINPGNQASGLLVFDIPKTAKIVSLELHDSPFSGGVVVTV